MPYYFVKKPPRRLPLRLPPKATRFLSVVFVIFGLFVIGQVIIPIASSFLTLLPHYSSEIASPLASYFRSPKIARAVEPDPYILSTWFSNTDTQISLKTGNLREYYLTIPKLKINRALVEIGGEDLKKSLIAWATSAYPGSYGVTVIFGHSQLPSLGSPDNYSGIFTHLMDLENSDEILITSDNVTYKYLVFDKKVVDPTDLSVLEQRFDKAYINLITCVPPGTLWKRGVVKARLVT